MGRKKEQRLLVSVRGPKEALTAVKSGAGIADVEYPASALGTPYPLNIHSVRSRLNRARLSQVPVSTNIGEVQSVRANACQAAVGVATAGAQLIKFGLADLGPEQAQYLGDSVVRSLKKLGPKGVRAYPAVFVDKDMRRAFDPFEHGPELVKEIKADGLLIDTFNKLNGKGLLDLCSVADIEKFVADMHRSGKEAWIAGSVGLEDLPTLWKTGVDVICVRGAACAKSTNSGRFGEVSGPLVRKLVETIP